MAHDASEANRRYGMVIDLDKCTGCQACSVACKMENDVDLGVFRCRVYRMGPVGEFPDKLEMFYFPNMCMQCEHPSCIEVCPTKATYKTEDGVVLVAASRCFGCQYCIWACPYEARTLNPNTKTVEKCTLCEQIVEQGGLPQCVIQCGGRARFFGDLDEGIASFEAPAVGYETDRTYDSLYEGTRVTLGELAQAYDERTDLHHLPNVGNNPNIAFILRNRDWKGEE